MPGLDGMMELSDEDRLAAIKAAFGRVMATPDGGVVFRTIFDAIGLFDPALNDDQRVRHNIGLELLQLFPGGIERMFSALLRQEMR
jgi:hypothetical protein